MAQVTGIVYVKIDSELQRSKEGAALDMGGKERTPQVGHSLYGFAEKVMPSVCTFKTAHVGGDDVAGLAAKVSATLEFETDTGDTFIIRNAFCSKTPKLTGGEGEVEWEFIGDPAEAA